MGYTKGRCAYQSAPSLGGHVTFKALGNILKIIGNPDIFGTTKPAPSVSYRSRGDESKGCSVLAGNHDLLTFHRFVQKFVECGFGIFNGNGHKV